MTPPIGFEAGTATHTTTHSSTIPGIVPDPPMVGLGYSRGIIKIHADGHEYVERSCEGCGDKHPFAPEVGWKRIIKCTVCRRKTSWRIVPALMALLAGGLLAGCGTQQATSKPAEFPNNGTNIYTVNAWHDTNPVSGVLTNVEDSYAAPTTYTYTNGFLPYGYITNTGLVLEVTDDTNAPAFYFDTYLRPKPILMECRVEGELVVRILSNGNVKFGEGVAPDEAAMVFWHMVGKLAKRQGL